MISVHGIYQHSAVLLDQPVNLPEGAHVRVTLDAEAAEPPDLCCDGAPWDDSPEGLRKWLEWCDSPEPVFTDEEYAQLQATLRSMREEQAPLLKQRAQTTDALFE